jgi:flagellar biosynthetic protein FliO
MSELTTFLRKWFESSTTRQKIFAALLACSLLITGVLLTLGDSSKTSSDPLGSLPFYYLSAFVKLLAVLLLIVGSSVILRRWQQGASSGKTTRQLRLLETIRISPRQALHLIAIGDQKILIGATDQQISLIAQAAGDVQPVFAQPQPGLNFDSVLQSFHAPAENLTAKE